MSNAPIDNITCSVCGCKGVHACMGPRSWPETETAIDLTGINGEVPTIPYKGLECRINPAGRYCLYWNGKCWRESASITNEDLERA